MFPEDADDRLLGGVSDALQNMMLQHRNMDTFIRHYLPRRITADTRAVVSGYEPQHDLMRAACRMTRWIDPNRPQELSLEESLSVNRDPYIRRLLAQREKWKQRFQGTVTKQSGYRILNTEIFNTRQRQRSALLKEVQAHWDLENPVNEIELQLSGLKFSEEVKCTLDLEDDMPPIQKRLVETIMTLPGTTLEEEFSRRNAAIDVVAAYCKFQEGGTVARSQARLPYARTWRISAKETCPQLAAAATENEALSVATLSVFKEERPTICFLCLGEEGLPFQRRTKSFASPGDLTKHFKRKHLANLKEEDLCSFGDWYGKEEQGLECKVCQMPLRNKTHLQNHAESIHGTIS